MSKWGGGQGMWGDVLRLHLDLHHPLHLMVSGGDTLYCDSVWELPALGDWMILSRREDRLQAPFTEQMRAQTVSR